MLIKLMKYEVKATARWFLPLYGALMAMAVLVRIFLTVRDSVYENSYSTGYMGASDLYTNFGDLTVMITTAIYMFVIAAVFVMATVIIIQRFYKNLLGDEGYLMFTLPVRPWENIVSKLIVAFGWILVSGVVTLISVAVIITDQWLIQNMSDMFVELWNALLDAGINGVGMVWITVVNAIVSTVGMVLQIYAAIAIGQLSNNHKVLCSFGAYLGINMVRGVIEGTVSMVLMLSGMGMLSGAMTALINPYSVGDLTSWMYISASIGLLLNVAYAVTFYVVTNSILSKRLNLE